MKRAHKRQKRDDWQNRRSDRYIARKIRQEKEGGFKCSHCKQWVVVGQYMGTSNRNHCCQCLWSKHVDVKKGDRKAVCQAGMRPIGLTFRIEGSLRNGELMLVHDCMGCDKISINRIAADDSEERILEIFNLSLTLSGIQKDALNAAGIYIATADDRQTVVGALFGYGYNIHGF